MSSLKSKTNSASSVVTDEKEKLCDKVNFATSEAYKRLRTNVLFSFADNENSKVIGVTSSVRGEGKSLTTANLAYAMAQSGKKVLLIDADLRIPSIASKLGIKKYPGMSDILVNVSTAEESLQHYVAGDGTKFDIISSGKSAPNPSELIGSEKMFNLIEEFKKQYEYIFVDLPPICAVADAVIISKATSGMIVVVRQDVCHTDSLKQTVDQLKFAGANIIGFVYNGASNEGKHYGKYKYSKYTKYSKDYVKTSRNNQ